MLEADISAAAAARAVGLTDSPSSGFEGVKMQNGGIAPFQFDRVRKSSVRLDRASAIHYNSIENHRAATNIQTEV